VAEEEVEEVVPVYTGEYELFVDRKAPPIPTFLGYVNVTEEDQDIWEITNHIRICLHIWETDTGNREMIRFINRNPFYTESVDGSDAEA